jgi:UDP-N-acetylmuramoylalanine--D-glutamate ligase
MVASACGEESSWVGGNIGNPLISDVDRMSPEDLAVVELSSFQLEIMDISPKIASILNVTPNHLDRHGTMEAYTNVKARIIDFQGKGDTAILSRDDPGSWALRDRVKGDLITFGRLQPAEGIKGTFIDGEWIKYWDGSEVQDLVPISSIQLRGEHNQLNALAACAIASAVSLPVGAMREGLTSLVGVEHRLEFVRSWGGADWFNDSIATAPERASAAIHSFEEPLVLLAGGRDKNLPWDDFAQLVVKRVRAVVCFGEAADLVESVIRASGNLEVDQLPIKKCSGLKEAVQVAGELIQPGDVVLLSPGGTSFDEFVDFAERGEMYKKWVHELS